MKKTFEVEIGSSFGVTICLDFDKQIEEKFLCMQEFWDIDEDLTEYDNDIINFGLFFIASKLFSEIVYCDLGIHNLVRRFNDAEGYPSINNDNGIEIIDYWWSGCDYNETNIHEV